MIGHASHTLAPLFDPKSLLIISHERLPIIATLPEHLKIRSTEILYPAGKTSTLKKHLLAKQQAERIDLAIIRVQDKDIIATLTAIQKNAPRALILLSQIPSQEYTLYCKQWAQTNDCLLLGPHSFGMQRPHVGLNASLHPHLTRSGRVAFISQSRSLTSSVMDWADNNSTAFSAIVSLGTEANLDIPRVLDFFAADTRTDAIALYIEDIRDARNFMSVLRAASSVKPVVILKAGRTDSHRSSVQPMGKAEILPPAPLPPEWVFDTAIRRAGAVRVRFFVQLFSVLKAFNIPQRPKGLNLALISNGTGAAQLALDQLSNTPSVRRATLTETTINTLKDALGPMSWTDNPVVSFDKLTPHQMDQALESLLNDNNVDGILTLLSPDHNSDMAGVISVLANKGPKASKTIVTCLIGEATMRQHRRELDLAKLPSFNTPEAALDAFGSLTSYYYSQQLLLQIPDSNTPSRTPDVDGANIIIDSARLQHRLSLTEPESKAILSAFHIPVVSSFLTKSPAEAVVAAEQIGFPIAIKIASPDIERKSSVRGVHLDIRNASELVTAFQRMILSTESAAPNARISGISVQSMFGEPGSLKLSIGIARDPLFGPVIRFGNGGNSFTPILDCSLELAPLNGFLARQLMKRSSLWSYALEDKFSETVLQQLEDVLVNVSNIACSLPELETLDINPLVVDETGVRAIDTRVTLTPHIPCKMPASKYAHMAIHPYPANLVQEHRFKDGTPYTIRPIRPEDAHELQVFTRGLSSHTRYMRFISTMRELSPKMLARYTQIDYHRELAIVATVQDPLKDNNEAIIGVARYLLNPDGESAEYALVIGDDWQKQGLGARLMRVIIKHAAEHGLKRIEGFVLGNNTPMQKLMSGLGFTSKIDDDDPAMRNIWLDLDTVEDNDDH